MIRNPKPLTSYQRRQRDIEFWKQRNADLETLCFELSAQLRANGVAPNLLLGNGIAGDAYLNDVNTGDFSWRLMTQTKE